MNKAARFITITGLPAAMCAAAFALGWLLSPASVTRPEAANDPRRTPVVQVVQQVAPAVVNISTDTIVEDHPFYGRRGDPFGFFRQFFEQPRPRQRVVPNSLGSGVIVDPRGFVLTNYHVLVRSNRVRVTLADGTELEAEPMGADPSSDLAVLKLKGEGPFPAVSLGSSSELMIGEPSVAIGNPFGLSHTVTTGVISALNRSVRAPDETVYSDFIQTDASINPGNSGGPLLNIRGELVGINTAIRPGAEGIGFAIPVDRARRVLDELIEYGAVRPLWLGMSVREITPEVARRLRIAPGGLMIVRIYDDGPAAEAGLRAGDRIVSADREPMDRLGDWNTRLGSKSPGDELAVEVERQDKQIRALMKLQALGEERALALVRERLGMVLEGPNSRERSRGYPEDALVVREVLPGGAADRRGFRPGDVVAYLEGKRVTNKEELAEIFAHIWDRRAAMLGVARRGNFYRVIVEMD